MWKYVFVILFSLSAKDLFAAGSFTPTPIPSNKQKTVKQQVAEDYILYAQIEKDVRDGKLKRRHKTEETARFPFDMTLYFDHSGKVREYVEEDGTDDNAFTDNYYYDDSGHLRIVATHYGDVQGTDDNQIILLDLEGHILQVNVEENFVNKEMGKNDHRKRVVKEPVDFDGVKVEFVNDPLKRFKER